MDQVEDTIGVITIVLDPAIGRPRLDIGNMSPLAAYTLLQGAADSLFECIPQPTIVYDGDIINEYNYIMDDEDED